MTETSKRVVWPKKYSKIAIFTIAFLIILINVFYTEYYTPIPLVILIFSVSALFFVLLGRYSIEWRNTSGLLLYRKLFIHSVFWRFVMFGFLSIYTLIYDPGSWPLEAFNNDSSQYLYVGTHLSGNIFNGEFANILPQYWRDSSDWGFPFYLGIVNSLFFNSAISVILLNILWGSLTVIFLSKTATLLYTARHGRLTGIIAMLLPSSMWFNVKYLKETLMIFIIVLVFYSAIKMVKKRNISLFPIVLILAGVTALLYFRTVLSVIVLFSLIIYLLVNIFSNKRKKLVAFFLLLTIVGGIYTISIYLKAAKDVEKQYMVLESGSANRIQRKLNSSKHTNLTLSVAVPIVYLNSFISPYPSFLNVDNRQISIISHAQNEFTRNLMYYFAFLGILLVFRHDLRNSSLIISFIAGYISLLAITGASYFDRFQLPAVTFMIIMMSVGIIDSSQNSYRNWRIYIFVVSCLIIAWNIFKVYIRQ